MKILDKHIAISVVVPLSAALVSLTAMWIIYDLIDRLGELLQLGASASDVLLFYAMQIPGILPMIIPFSTLLAVLAALTGMIRNGELIAMFAGGVSVLRFSIPILLLGIVVGIFQFSIETTSAPLSVRERNEQLEEFRAQARNRERRVGPRIRSAVYFNEANNRIWFIRRADVLKQELSDVEILQTDNKGNDVWKIFAKQLRFNHEAGWEAREAKRVSYLNDGSLTGDPVFISREKLEGLDETFTQVAAAVYTPDLLNLSELRHFLQSNPQLSQQRLAPYQSAEVRQLWSFAPSLGAVFIVLGLCLRASRRSGLTGVGLPIVFFVLYVLIDQFCFAVGKSARLPPIFIVSFPHVMWMGLGFALYYSRLRRLLY